MSTPPFSAPADRNKVPILDVLRRVLPEAGLVLEIASGTGQHVLHFAEALPGLRWQPTDADPDIQNYLPGVVASSGLANIEAPLHLDVTKVPWPVASANAVVCVNMIHISPWEATLALLDGASALLRSGEVLYLYGPYRREDRHTAPSNEAFDESLRSRNPAWGIRDMERVASIAGDVGFSLAEVVPMPANNFSVVFNKV
ncbi:MAG: DUF938 domain-containing protein [Candidatus Rariloculaceae bacterium]